MAMLPAWFPSDAALLAVVVGLVALAVVNRQKKWVKNAIDVDAPIIVGAGAFIALANDSLSSAAGIEPAYVIAGGVVVAMFGILR